MLYSIVRGFLRFIFYFLGLKAEGLENIPSSGPVIIAANHVSNWDPVVLALVLNRPVYFMGKTSLFKYKIMAAICTALHAFPVKRGVPDRQAIRRALQVLEEGNILGIFPEGARNPKGDIKALAGVGMIAIKSGAPVVPVACLGTRHTIPCGWFDPLLVRVGQPVCNSEIPDQGGKSVRMERFSEAIMNKINILLRK
jgi:1-acyl-sn-glycerol-3-phosphate acyltransferase